MAQYLKQGLKFHQKTVPFVIFEIIKTEPESNSVLVKITDKKENTEDEKKMRIDDIQYFLGTGDYVVVNERPEVNKHDQLENCGSHSD